MAINNTLIKSKADTTENILSFLLAVFAILKLSPYFLWETFNDGAYERLIGNIQTANIIALLILAFGAWELTKKERIAAKDLVLVILVFISGLVIIHISGRNDITVKSWINYLTLCVYLLMNDTVKYKSFTYFKYIFTITLIPALFWYISTNLLSVTVEYESITPPNTTKVAYEYTYMHYPGGVQLSGRWEPIARYRFNGIYDEPGVVGTVAGLLLPTNLLKGKKEPVINFLLFVEGVLSLSLAFIIFILFYFIFDGIFSGKTKAPLVIIGLVIIYLIFTNIHFSNDAISTIQGRLQITNTGLAGYNRTSELFRSIYSEFQHSSDLFVLMFGCGPGMVAVVDGKSCSYQNIIYECGYVGFVLFMCFVISCCILNIKNKNGKKVLVFLILILSNIYQRAGLFFFPYMLILISGVTYLTNESPEEPGAGYYCRVRNRCSLRV